MKYFQLQFRDYMTASEAIWAAEDAAGESHTNFHVSAEGSSTELWVTDPDKEQQLRDQLVRLGIEFEEFEERQVRNPMADLVHNSLSRPEERPTQPEP